MKIFREILLVMYFPKQYRSSFEFPEVCENATQEMGQFRNNGFKNLDYLTNRK